jgi:type I restriction enzyme S subunit
MSNRYNSYKETGEWWIGVIPDHWQLTPLWALYQRRKRTGFSDEPLLSVYRDFGVIVKSSRDDNFNKASDDLGDYQLVEPGDLAIN